MLYIRTHILHIRYIRTYIYIKWRKQKNKKKHHLIITHCSRRFHTNGIIEFRITCVWQESTSQGGSWRREASSFFFFFFHFMYQLLCLCQYVSKNKTLSFSGVCFNPNRNATAITQHVSLKFVEQTIGNNEPTESVVSSFPSLPLPLCFLSFFFFFRKFSPLYVCRSSACAAGWRARSRAVRSHYVRFARVYLHFSAN